MSHPKMACFAQETHGLAHGLNFCVSKPGQDALSHLLLGKVLTSLDRVSLSQIWLGNTSSASFHTTFVEMNWEEIDIM